MTALSDAPLEQDGHQRSASRPHRASRRLGRLSTGHLLMILAGAVAVVANYAVLRSADETLAVLVADAPIAAGAPLDPAALAVGEVATGGTVTDRLVPVDERESMAGTVAASAIDAGDPLRRSDLRPAAAPGGQRAMSVPVDADHAAGGRLRAGDRVDVIETVDGAATYLVTGAEVLDVPEGGALEGLRRFSLTIAVDADEALRLAEAIHTRDLDVVRATGAAEPAGETTR